MDIIGTINPWGCDNFNELINKIINKGVRYFRVNLKTYYKKEHFEYLTKIIYAVSYTHLDVYKRQLPNNAFKNNAGTEVTSDILFLKKRERQIDIEPDWVHLGYTKDGIPINSYFVEHPEMVLGKMEYDTGRYGVESHYTVCVNNDENFNMYESLSNALNNVNTSISNFEIEETEKNDEVIIANRCV